MNGRLSLGQMAAMFLALLLVAMLAIVAVPRLGKVTGFSIAPARSPGSVPVAAADTFDYKKAADAMAARWIAMGSYYAKHGLLTRDNFNYEQAADNSAVRWVAIGEGYRHLGLLDKEHAGAATLVPGAVVLGMVEALNAGDLEWLLAYWAEDAHFFIYGLPPYGAEVISGKEALRAEFAGEIEAHQKLDSVITSVRGDIVTTHDKTLPGFTRQLDIAPLEATSVYQIVDGKIISHTWRLTQESADRLKAALARTPLARSTPSPC